MARSIREVTNKIYEAVDEGVLTWQQIAEAALTYMSESDVADMAHNEEFFMYEDEEEDEEEWSPYTADFNDKGSIHHY
jgi:hypothetical protein